jgi:hypothetical protein
MEKWLLTVETNCNNPSQEKEFNDWYDNTHLPDVLGIPAIQRATRYESGNPAEGRGKFVALYEIETDDALQVLAELSEGMIRWTEQGRISELITILSASLYRQITAPVESK